MIDNPRVVARSQSCGARTTGKSKQLGKAKAPVAPDAGIGRLAARVPADERLHHGAAELLPQVERDVRQPEPVTGRAGREHGLGRAARPLGVGAGRVEPESERDADRVRARLDEGDGAVHAPAHGNGHALRVRLGPKRRAESVRQRVDRERLPTDGRRLEQRQPVERPLEPRGVGGPDPVAVEDKPNERELLPARRVPDDLDHAVTVATLEKHFATDCCKVPLRAPRRYSETARPRSRSRVPKVNQHH